MSLKNLQLKKSYSPARMIIVDDPIYKPVPSLKNLRSRKSLITVPSLHPDQNNEIRSSPKVYFSVKHRPEIYLFEPPILDKQLIKKSNIIKNRRINKANFAFESPTKLSKQPTRMLEESKNLLKVIEKSENAGKSEIEIKFFSLIKNNNIEDLEILLDKHPKLVSACDSIGMTGLHWAAKRNLLEITTILLKHGSDVQKKDILNRASIDIARKCNNIELVQIFTEILIKLRKTSNRIFTN